MVHGNQGPEERNQEPGTKNQKRLATSDGTLKTTDFDLVKVGLLEEAETEQSSARQRLRIKHRLRNYDVPRRISGTNKVLSLTGRSIRLRLVKQAKGEPMLASTHRLLAGPGLHPIANASMGGQESGEGEGTLTEVPLATEL
jgi:hypothetical protein